MTAHTVIDPCQDDVPEDILSSTIAFVMAVRGIPVGELMEPIRKEALRQHRREQIIRTKGVVAGVMYSSGKVPSEQFQIDYQWDCDEAEYGQEWCKI